jgi:acetyl-CoA C-acetyltransferase
MFTTQLRKVSDVVIVAAKRTPFGGFMGGLSKEHPSSLGSIAIKAALTQANLDPNYVDEVYLGNVLQAAGKQAPARQAALNAGLPDKVPCTTINKVCASGLKSVMIGA